MPRRFQTWTVVEDLPCGGRLVLERHNAILFRFTIYEAPRRRRRRVIGTGTAKTVAQARRKAEAARVADLRRHCRYR